MQITEVKYDTPDETHGTVLWQDTFDVGTCRARLSLGFSRRVPILDESSLAFDIFILSRYGSFREKIRLTRESPQPIPYPVGSLQSSQLCTYR
jgi:hypothetical protein